MNRRGSILAVGFLCSWVMASSQIQHPGTPMTKNRAVKAEEVVHTVAMPLVDVGALLAEDSVDAEHKDIPFRFGYPHQVNYGITNSGTWDTLPNGDKVWRLRLESSGAISLNLIFDRFFLPKGSTMFIYGQDGSMILGAFTEQNNLSEGGFSTAPIKGSRIVVEYDQPHDVTGAPELNISVIVHAYRDIFKMAEGAVTGFGDSGPCHFNVNCPEGSAWTAQANGVAMILLSNNSRICSGTLINNVRNDGTPYFLTANHCWDPSQPTWIFMFKYESATCSNPVQEPATTYTISGSALKARNADSDFLLLQLSSTPPPSYNVYYPGWNRQDVAATSGVGIHHPKGDIKKISFSNSSYVSDTWTGTPANSHWRVYWSQVSGKTAVTEVGSSGSPIFDQNKRVVGQLHGGPSYCGAPSGSLNDLYGKFSMSWDRGTSSASRLKDWLDPENTGVMSIDGMQNVSVSVTVQNSFGGGLVKVDGATFSSGIVFTWTAGSQHTLEAFNQDFVDPSNNTNYYRVYRDWTKPGEVHDVTNPLPISVPAASATYTANYNRQFNIQISVASYIESGTGGAYKVNGANVGSSWSGTWIENVNSPITLEAVPPAGGDWVFVQWSDGNRGNPRTVTPSDHTTLSAVFKRHLKANTSLALSPTGQRKLVLAETGTANRLFLAYESGGGSFRTAS